MRTETWSFKKTPFPPKFCQNGRGAKRRSESQWRYEPQINAIWKVESTKNILHSLFDFSKLIDYFI